MQSTLFLCFSCAPLQGIVELVNTSLDIMQEESSKGNQNDIISHKSLARD